MYCLLEDWTPYDQSILWRIHERYYALCGVSVWNDGEVPWLQTNNAGLATDTAQFLLDLSKTLEREGRLGPHEQIRVLEVGGGGGRFAALVCDALEQRLGDGGAALLRRLRYVFSDFSAKTVQEAAESDHLRPWIARGVVVPALFDLRSSGTPTLLGQGEEMAPASAVITSYVCDATPCKVLRRTNGFWEEQTVRVAIELEDGPEEAGADLNRLLDQVHSDRLLADAQFEYGWQPFEPAEAFVDPLHSRALSLLGDSVGDMCFAYHQSFIEFLRRSDRLLVRGGVALINDYGPATRRQLYDNTDRRPSIYGNSLSHGVAFSLLDAFASVAQWQVRRTTDPMASLHTAALRHGVPFTESLARSFRRIFCERAFGEELLDLGAAAQALFERGRPMAAARFYRRALELDPTNVESHYRLGEACLEASLFEVAASWLLKGLALDPDGPHDFEFQIGRAFASMQNHRRAEDWYRRSLRREEHATTHTNLGVVLAAQRRHREAYHAFRRARSLDPDYAPATERLAELAIHLWQLTETGPEADQPDESQAGGEILRPSGASTRSTRPPAAGKGEPAPGPE